MAVEVRTDCEGLGQGGNSSSRLNASIRKRYCEGNSFQLAVDFTVPAGITIVFGPSGAGKTTLLDSIAGLETPDSGSITVADGCLFDSSAKINLSVSRRRIGYVFQEPALFPHLSVKQNIRYGMVGLSLGEQHSRTDRILEGFRITHLGDRRPSDISGGEKQRVALARALVIDPRLLLLDEPLAGLDQRTKSKIVDDLRTWNQAHGIPILYVTHSRDEVFALGERVIVLEAGKIIDQGTPHQVMRAPRYETVAQLAGFENIFDALVVSTHEDRGTMTCRLTNTRVELETPLVRAGIGDCLRVAISAGDIILASVPPIGLSARNVLEGKLVSLSERDVIIRAVVDCGVEMEVHLTPAARDSLHLEPGRSVWLIVKTHSCHLMEA